MTGDEGGTGNVTQREAGVGSARTQQTLRQTLQLLGLTLTGLLAVVMLVFVAFDWLRHFGGPLGNLGANGFEQYRIAGEWIDYGLGTNTFRHPFVLRGIATGVFVGIAGPLVGTFLVHRQMALIGETLAHTAFAGVAVGVVIAGLTGMAGTSDQLLLIAIVVSAVAALGLQWLIDHSDAYGDVPIAIVLTGSFAIGTLLISWGRERAPMPIEIEDFLFGSIAIVTAEDTRLVAILSVAVVAVIAINYKQFLFITFDEQAARVARLNVSVYNAMLVVMTAVVVVGAMQMLGVILVAGLLVIPPATASQLGGDFRDTLVLSVLFGQASVLGGLGMALWFGHPPGGSIIVVAILFYLLAIAFSSGSPRELAIH